jgi:beta-N-acetylhexosaminidase
MSLGPLMIDLADHHLSEDDRRLLRHPLVGGVILFSRNYHSPQQITELVDEIHKLRQPPLLVAVDHEGGRVQRFREGFVHLPPAAHLGKLYDQDAKHALAVAEQLGWLLAAELRAVGVDLSFAPVLDLGRGISTVIDDRAFHADPQIVAHATMRGMRSAGMMAVGKHFPGHGSVVADSHHAVPVDERRFADIQFEDLIPFERLINMGLPAIMPAHVIYPQIDVQPAGFSTHWLQTILRQILDFRGAIFSDDVSMAGAAVAGDITARTRQALHAGCDMVLICNDRPAVETVIEQLGDGHSAVSQVRLIRLHGLVGLNWETLHRDARWLQAEQLCRELEHTPELNLNDDELY